MAKTPHTSMRMLQTQSSSFRIIHSVSQLSIYGAASNWCEKFGLIEEEKEQGKPLGREESVTKGVSSLKFLEVKLWVSPPRLASGNSLSSKNQRERSIDNTKKCDELKIPVADGTTKIVREIPRMPREDFKGEHQSEPGESQPTESTDNAEACADIWSIQSDFIYRHHNEPQVPLYIDETRSTYTDLDVMREKRVDDYWNADSNRNLSEFVENIREVHSVGRKTSQTIYVVRGENDTGSTDYQT